MYTFSTGGENAEKFTETHVVYTNMKEILIKDRQTNVLKVLSFRTIPAPTRFNRDRSRILMAHFKTNTGCNIFHRPSKGIFKSVRQVKQLILKIQRKRNLIAAEKSHACVRPDRSSYIAHIPSHDDAIFKHLPVPNQPTNQHHKTIPTLRP